MTSIKVTRVVRDRLAAAAHTRGQTVRALLEEFSRQAEDAALMGRVATEMRQLSESDPKGWEDYLAEGRAWEEGTVEHIDP
jgi:hypothetical protein